MKYFEQQFVEELNDEGPVTIREFDWPTVEVFKAMAPDLYAAHFVDWLGGTKEAAKDRAKEFLNEYGCLGRFNHLAEQCSHNKVMPFVGAGMSRLTGFPLWGDFLFSLCVDYPNCRADLQALLDTWRYEEAAQLMAERMGKNNFDEAIHITFGNKRRGVSGPVQLLPNIFTRGALTTNFDYILDLVYGAAGVRFDAVLSGEILREAPRRLASNPHSLIRLHGEADTAVGRILTRQEYEGNYGDEGNYRQILGAITNSTSLLFLGCSLTVDRTLSALVKLKEEAKVASPRHYAFLPLRDGLDREKRRTELGAADIYPIWYPPDDPDQAIEDLLISLIEGGLHD